MRRILSESWTFIWQPKVLIQAVLLEPGLRADGRGLEASGLNANGMGAATRGISLILVLRFVDPGPHRNLARSDLDLQFLYLQVPGPRGPPKYIRDLRFFPVAQREHRPPTPRRTPLPPGDRPTPPTRNPPPLP